LKRLGILGVHGCARFVAIAAAPHLVSDAFVLITRPLQRWLDLASGSSRLATTVALAALVGIVGCRNNAAQSDLIQREMRHQEDQIYALQDYLAEYQQLLCEARAENEALRKQSVRGQFRDGSPKSDDDTLPTPPATPPSPPAGANESEIKLDDHIEMTLPDAPPLVPEPPEAPPLDTSSQDNAAPDATDDMVESAPAADANLEEDQDRVDSGATETSTVVNASYEEPTIDSAETELSPSEIAAVAMRAEVVAADDIADDDDAAGPRVLLDVLPLAADGTAVSFDGRLSLMFRDPAATGKAQVVARWDFAADELADFVHETSHGNTFVFPLQLPQRVPTDRRMELWVRLIPLDGEKVIRHSALDLGRSARFVYDERVRPRKVDHAVETASHEVETDSAPESTTAAAATSDGWQTARPGAVPELSTAGDNVGGTWRTSTQPIPIVESRPATPDPLDSMVPDDRYGPAPGISTAAKDVPQWLPERPHDDADGIDEQRSPPAWSATR
jgi:hypothetical protein